MSSLVIVESQAKAKTIAKYLGPGYTVKVCFGHVRDLPRHVSDLSDAQRALPWAQLGVNIDRDYALLYVVPPHRPGDSGPDKQLLLKQLEAQVRRHTETILATDPDREGEAIAYSLAQQLRLGERVKRVTFNEITEQAVKHAVASPRRIDMNLVRAQEARRALDRLCGYKISPVVARTVARGASAGRVQSAALAALAKAEHARMAHVGGRYVRLTADLTTDQGTFTAQLVQRAGVAVATPKDFQADGTLKPDVAAVILGEHDGRALAQRLKGQHLSVLRADQTPFTTRPPAPFTTAALQQQASIQLKIDPKETMNLAQQLYEGGLITYMRTDSVSLSDEGVQAARAAVQARYGSAALPPSPRQHHSKAKNAQEAHEAIRPSGAFPDPATATLDGAPLSGPLLALYDLIYRRTLASQMTDMQGVKTAVYLGFDSDVFAAAGKVVTDAGFTVLYDDARETGDEPQLVPPLPVGTPCLVKDAAAEVRSTPAPPRFTLASLVKALESSEVGRPSTYVPTLDTLQERGYVTVIKRQLVVTWRGLLVSQYLTENFSLFTSAQFTALMETELDQIASGNVQYAAYLDHFWRGQLEPAVARASTQPPVLPVPGVAGASVRLIDGQPTLIMGGLERPIPEQVMPEDLTVDVAQGILSGQTTFKKPVKKKK